MTVEFIPKGVCSRYMKVSAQDGIITQVQVFGGCNGNLQGLSRLLPGMRVADAVSKLQGISCGERGTSCPDQMSIALREIMAAEKALLEAKAKEAPPENSKAETPENESPEAGSAAGTVDKKAPEAENTAAEAAVF